MQNHTLLDWGSKAPVTPHCITTVRRCLEWSCVQVCAALHSLSTGLHCCHQSQPSNGTATEVPVLRPQWSDIITSLVDSRNVNLWKNTFNTEESNSELAYYGAAPYIRTRCASGSAVLNPSVPVLTPVPPAAHRSNCTVKHEQYIIKMSSFRLHIVPEKSCIHLMVPRSIIPRVERLWEDGLK